VTNIHHLSIWPKIKASTVLQVSIFDNSDMGHACVDVGLLKWTIKISYHHQSRELPYLADLTTIQWIIDTTTLVILTFNTHHIVFQCFFPLKISETRAMSTQCHTHCSIIYLWTPKFEFRLLAVSRVQIKNCQIDEMLTVILVLSRIVDPYPSLTVNDTLLSCN
jgi:hypothetical protein